MFDDRVVWIKIEGIAGGNLWIACVYAPNIPTEWQHLSHIMNNTLPKDCKWIIAGDINMTKQLSDKPNDCGRNISDLERLCWNNLLNSLHLHDSSIYQGGPKFSWCNGQQGKARRLARLDRFYTPINSGLHILLVSYFIHGYIVSLDFAPVQIELNIGKEEVKKSHFKWNVSHLSGNFG